MRRAMHILSLAAVLVGLILWQRPALERLIERVRTETRRLSVAENTVPNIAYVLNDRNWTAFSLSGVGGTVRIVSNASVAETEPPSVPETEWHYALSYQLLDAGNQVLREGSYHHYTTLTPLVADSDDAARDRAPLYNARYLNLPFQPADSRLIRLNIAGTPGADKLRLRIETMDPAIRDVVARVFMRRKYSEQRIPYWWARTRADKRAKLAEGNVYPPDLLRQQERANILRNLWHALGPAGIEGIDYARRDLYILNDIDTSEADKPSEPPAGVWITEKLLGVVPIPEGLTLVRVTFLDCDDPARPQPSGFVLRWYGKGLQKRTSYSVSWTGSGTQWEQALEGGLLEIEVQGEGDPDRTPCAAAVARIALVEGDAVTDITPEPPMFLRGYITQAETPVEYPVNHVAGQDTPFRIDLRRYLAAGEPSDTPNPMVEIDWLGQDGTLIDTSSVWVDTPLSIYDWVAGRNDEIRISDPAKFYFSLPESVAAIRITSELPVIAMAYNRPPELVRQIRVPDDYYAFSEDTPSGSTSGERQPSWFPLPPREADALRMRNQSLIVNLQYRPPEDDPDLLAGRYKWEAFDPEGSWLARSILTPREPMDLFRPEMLPVVYRTAFAGKAYPLEFRALPGLRTVEPSLVYLRDAASPMDVQVSLDGQVWYKGRVAGRCGELALPTVTAGSHTFCLDAPPSCQWLINSAGASGDTFLKRTVVRFDRGSLTFPLDKSAEAEELLQIVFYRREGTAEESVLHVQVEGAGQRTFGPSLDWSFLDRRYVVRAPGAVTVEAGPPAPVLNTNGERVEAGQPLFLPLGADIGPGIYRVRLTLEAGPGGYVQLSRTVPGMFERRTFHLESALE